MSVHQWQPFSPTHSAFLKLYSQLAGPGGGGRGPGGVGFPVPQPTTATPWSSELALLPQPSSSM